MEILTGDRQPRLTEFGEFVMTALPGRLDRQDSEFKPLLERPLRFAGPVGWREAG